MSANEITGAIIGCAMKLHSRLGPGLLEKPYEICLVHELVKLGFKAETQVALPLVYDGLKIDCAYRMDLVVEDTVVVELKAAETLLPIHEAQLLSYLKLSGKPIGLLINFHMVRLKDGIKRIINGVL